LGQADASRLPAYAGEYEFAGGTKPVVVTIKGTHLYVQAEALGPDAEELLPESDLQFFVVSAPLAFNFQKDDQGAVTRMTIHTDFQTMVARKVR
jgi:hypothetical protein